MLIDLGRCRVDVDDLPILVRMPEVRVVLDHVVPDTDDDVRAVKAARDVVVSLQANGAEAERVRRRDRALRHERRSNRNVQSVDERN